MQIKAVDDRQADLETLERLAGRQDVDAGMRARIEKEIRAIRAGVAGEREAAYEIEFLFGNNPNRLTIHDLRLEVGGRVAQIDHLVINRVLETWILESKHFAEGVAVNEHGEWVAFRGRRPYGIPSPVEQNRRHAAVLADVFSTGLVQVPRRLGIALRPQIRGLVLVSKGARISRPPGRAKERVDGLDTVLKVDQLRARLQAADEARGVTALARLVSPEALREIARSLAGLHRPINVDWTARFGLSAEAPNGSAPPSPSSTATILSTETPGACLACGRRVSAAVVAYCRDHAARFAGGTYCMTCQGRFPSRRGA